MTSWFMAARRGLLYLKAGDGVPRTDPRGTPSAWARLIAGIRQGSPTHIHEHLEWSPEQGLRSRWEECTPFQNVHPQTLAQLLTTPHAWRPNHLRPDVDDALHDALLAAVQADGTLPPYVKAGLRGDLDAWRYDLAPTWREIGASTTDKPIWFVARQKNPTTPVEVQAYDLSGHTIWTLQSTQAP